MNGFYRRKTFTLLAATAFCMQSSAATLSATSEWKQSLLVGYGITHAEQTQNVHLEESPLPGLDNRYVGNSKLYGAFFLGLALEKEFKTSLKNTIGAAGFEMDYLQNKSVDGTVMPMVNVSPDFDTLRYSYDIHSLVFQATGKLTKEAMFQKVNGYLQAGLGAAINRLSDYQEFPPGDSTASPMLSPFGNRDTFSPAISAGFGINYKLADYNTRVSFGYRYFNTYRGRLNKSGDQQTNSSIVLSPISYHFLMLGVTL